MRRRHRSRPTVRRLVQLEAKNCDTALVGGPRVSYTITGTTATEITVNQIGAPVAPQKISDGIDTLRNVERVQFSNPTSTAIIVHSAPTNVTAATNTATAARVSFVAPATNTGLTDNANGRITNFEVTATPTTGAPIVARLTNTVNPPANGFNFTGLAVGTTYTFQVRAVNTFGPGPLSAASLPFSTAAAAPSAPTSLIATAGNSQVNLTWTAPASNGGSAITGYNLQVRQGTTVLRTDPVAGAVTSTLVTGLTNGTNYNFRLQAINAAGTSPFSAASNVVRPVAVPDAPVIANATQGPAGGALTAVANWTFTGSNGGSAITRLDRHGLRLGRECG